MKDSSIETMFSGYLSLEINENVTWDEFPNYATALVSKLNAKVVEKTEGVDMVIWDLLVSGVSLKLVYQDYPQAISLESDTAEGDRKVREIESYLNQTE